MAQLADDKRAAVFATDGFEESELIEPVKALREAGVQVDVVSLNPGKIQAFRHDEKSIQVNVDRTVDQARPDDYQLLVLPGGALNADTARIDTRAKEFVRSFQEADKPDGGNLPRTVAARLLRPRQGAYTDQLQNDSG